MTDADLLDTITRVVLRDAAFMSDITPCQTAGVDVLTACRNLYGWTDPAARIAHGDMNAVLFVQALQLARARR